ncbi:aspartate-semialdehyde dehydrogenase [Ruminococcaceae bacterium OttesenSCG-928-I18]|nr:aspartate-semialdehyde dehydrogenase [Ruminococcaceae bacterium OttesenSCG-928-I18]
MKEIRVAVVGASGMVGRTFLRVLEEYNLPVSEYVLMASARSAGKTVAFFDREYVISELTEQSFDSGFDVALFSAGGSVSKQFAPIAAAKGCVVVDNSSQWRMEPDVPLVVPEVNPEALQNHKNIIANPNCSTIQAMLPLKAIMEEWGLKRVIYSTYQAVSGAGLAGYKDLENGAVSYLDGKEQSPQKFPHPIFSNCLPHIDVFLDNDYTKEEQKMVNETRKILGDDRIGVTATTVRVPVFDGHSESINIETHKPFEIEDVKKKLADFHEGMVLVDDPANNKYPLALDAAGRNEVFVGRVRRDYSIENGINLWCVADNIRKGAATNTVQIAKYMLEHGML